jgi:hypothetical protein
VRISAVWSSRYTHAFCTRMSFDRFEIGNRETLNSIVAEWSVGSLARNPHSAHRHLALTYSHQGNVTRAMVPQEMILNSHFSFSPADVSASVPKCRHGTQQEPSQSSDFRALSAEGTWNPSCTYFVRREWTMMPTLTDTTLVILCPHCVLGIEFRPMIAYKDGRFVCRDCAHTVRPGIPDYTCTCRPCLKIARGDDASQGSVIFSTDFS